MKDWLCKLDLHMEELVVRLPQGYRLQEWIVEMFLEIVSIEKIAAATAALAALEEENKTQF